MIPLLGLAVKWFAGGALGRILDTIDKKVDSKTEREKIKAEAIQAHFATQADVIKTSMSSKVFWLVWFVFAAPLGLWFAAVMLDTIFLFGWLIADIPASIKPWAATIFGSIFGSGAGAVSVQSISSAIRGRRR